MYVHLSFAPAACVAAATAITSWTSSCGCPNSCRRAPIRRRSRRPSRRRCRTSAAEASWLERRGVHGHTHILVVVAAAAGAAGRGRVREARRHRRRHHRRLHLAPSRLHRCQVGGVAFITVLIGAPHARPAAPTIVHTVAVTAAAAASEVDRYLVASRLRFLTEDALRFAPHPLVFLGLRLPPAVREGRRVDLSSSTRRASTTR